MSLIIPINNDTILEDNENFILTIGYPSSTPNGASDASGISGDGSAGSGTSGDQATVTIIIMDDDRK